VGRCAPAQPGGRASTSAGFPRSIEVAEFREYRHVKIGRCGGAGRSASPTACGSAVHDLRPAPARREVASAVSSPRRRPACGRRLGGPPRPRRCRRRLGSASSRVAAPASESWPIAGRRRRLLGQSRTSR
jgi:hypothetical protein